MISQKKSRHYHKVYDFKVLLSLRGLNSSLRGTIVRSTSSRHCLKSLISHVYIRYKHYVYQFIFNYTLKIIYKIKLWEPFNILSHSRLLRGILLSIRKLLHKVKDHHAIFQHHLHNLHIFHN